MQCTLTAQPSKLAGRRKQRNMHDTTLQHRSQPAEVEAGLEAEAEAELGMEQAAAPLVRRVLLS